MLARSVMSVVSVPVQSIRLGIRKDDGGAMPKAQAMAEDLKVSQ